MKTVKFAFNVLVAVGVIAICSSMANAQATRTWVSGVGDDANPCSRTAPCKTFAGAISKTANGGEISVLDPGGYGAVTITKSITIDGGTGAGWGSVIASSVNAVIINATTTDKIILRNLSLHGAGVGANGTGLNGIRFLAGGQLTVENLVIFGFTLAGIEVNKTANGNVYVKNTNFTKCANGITATTTGGFVVLNLDNVTFEGLTNGYVGNANSFAVVRNSSFFQNTGNGISAAAGATINVESSMFAHNGTGVNSAAGSAINLSNASIFNNATGINAAGTVRGFFNNRVFGNGVNGAVNAQTVQQ